MNKVKEMEIIEGPTGAYTPTKTIDIYLCERKISTITVVEGRPLRNGTSVYNVIIIRKRNNLIPIK